MLDGKPMVREKVNVGYLPEERGLYPKVGILEQLLYLGRLRGLTRHDARKNAIKWLSRLSMEEYAGKKTGYPLQGQPAENPAGSGFGF